MRTVLFLSTFLVLQGLLCEGGGRTRHARESHARDAHRSEYSHGDIDLAGTDGDEVDSDDDGYDSTDKASDDDDDYDESSESASPSTPCLRPRSPWLYEFAPTRMLHTDRLHENSLHNVKEVLPQVYMFNLFTSEYASALVKEAESCGAYRRNPKLYWEQGEDPEVSEMVPPDTWLDLEKMPGLEIPYFTIAEHVLIPMIRQVWRSFSPKVVHDPYVKKYELRHPRGQKNMMLHNDAETVALIIYLNDAYTGGGTFFHRWNKTIANPPPRPGTAVFYPGRVSHEHLGATITSGLRYLMIGAFD